MDKKLKKAADKITMPEDMKERIIRACESAEKNNITRIDNEEGYAEVVSGTERVAPRIRIIRTVSAAAACLVLLAGIGTTGVCTSKEIVSHLRTGSIIPLVLVGEFIGLFALRLSLVLTMTIANV